MNDMKDPMKATGRKSIFTQQPTQNATSTSSEEQEPPATDPHVPDTPRPKLSDKTGGKQEGLPDLDAMTLGRLQSYMAEVRRMFQEKSKANRRAIINQIVEVVNDHDIPVDELVDALGGLKRKLGPAARKYRDPVSGATWSGRGKEPIWLRGKDRTKFQIR